VGRIARFKSPAEAKKLYTSLDPELKKTEKGAELGKMFNEVPIPTAEPAQPAAPAEAPGKSNAEPGSTAPAFSANTPAGKKLSLKEAMGKVTIIDFWASWCPPCRKENPNVVALYKQYHSKGLNIIGVSLDKPGNADKWKQAIAADNLTWNHVSNLMFWDEPIAKLYGVESIPATFVLDANGKIVAKDLRGPALSAKVAELLAK
jgi:thiol-disulfide isomerase/thioredoxin